VRKKAFKLSDEGIEILESERSAAKEAGGQKYDRRLRGLLLCGREGKTQQEAAEIVEFSPRHFQKIIRQYRAKGIQGIAVHSPPGRTPALTD